MSQQTSTSYEMNDFLVNVNDADESVDSVSGNVFAANVGTQKEPTVGDLDLEVRSSLRRLARSVACIEFEKTIVKYRQLRLERVVLLGIWTSEVLQETEVVMEELATLTKTAGSEALEVVLRRRDRPDPDTYVGSGKLDELRDIVASTGADTVIYDDELSPDQLVALEGRLNAKIIGRTMLILDIFVQHAKSREGKAQVSLAQMQYLYTCLHDWGGNLSRQAGGRTDSNGDVGSCGPDETKIETGRRWLCQDMVRIHKKLTDMKTAHEIKRACHKAGHLPRVAIVSYTSTGRSLLPNALIDAGTLVEGTLFATLNPMARRTKLRDSRTVIMTDTVRFVRHLPAQLIKASRPTLEEVLEADVIIHAVDSFGPFPLDQIKAASKVISKIVEEEKAEIPPELLATNEVDKADDIALIQLCRQPDSTVFISVRAGEGIGELKTRLELTLNELESHAHMLIPYDKGDTVFMLREDATALSETWTEQGTQIDMRLPISLADELSTYHIEPAADTDFTADANEESSIDS